MTSSSNHRSRWLLALLAGVALLLAPAVTGVAFAQDDDDDEEMTFDPVDADAPPEDPWPPRTRSTATPGPRRTSPP